MNANRFRLSFPSEADGVSQHGFMTLVLWCDGRLVGILDCDERGRCDAWYAREGVGDRGLVYVPKDKGERWPNPEAAAWHILETYVLGGKEEGGGGR